MKKMKFGKMLKPGDVIIAEVFFADSSKVKLRPALVLFEEFDNVIVAGITSNTSMNGIFLSKKEGAVKDSVIKLNYIFTISTSMVKKVLFHLSKDKKRQVFNELLSKFKILYE